MPRARPIAISGPMGAGKSAVARALAARAGVPLVDVDGEVEREAGRSIATRATPAFTSRRPSVRSPGSVCSTANRSSAVPCSSTTQIAWARLA